MAVRRLTFAILKQYIRLALVAMKFTYDASLTKHQNYDIIFVKNGDSVKIFFHAGFAVVSCQATALWAKSPAIPRRKEVFAFTKAEDWTMEEIKIKDIITDIENGVGTLEQLTKTADVSADEVRRIKRSILSIRGAMALCSEEEHSKHLKVLRLVLDYVNELVKDPADIEMYADSIESCIEKMHANTGNAKYSDVIFNKLNVLEEKIEEKLDDLSAMESRRAEAENVGGDIKKAVNYALKRNPPAFSDAHRTIRACIENYCRYQKGFDLNDRLFIEDLSVEQKFTLAKIDNNIIDDLTEVYKLANRFIHEDRSLNSMTLNEKIKCTVENVELLKKWHIDEFDERRGTAVLYVCRDLRLRDLLDKTSERDIEAILSKNLSGYFQKAREYEEQMREDDTIIPDIIFKSKKDVYDYLNAKKTGGVFATAHKTDGSRLLEWHKKETEHGNFDSCIWIGAYYNNNKEVVRAAEYYKLATTLDDADNKINKISGSERSHVGLLLYVEKEYSAALKWIDNITDIPSTVVLGGDCYYAQKNYSEAIRRYRFVDASALTEDRQKKFVANSIRFTEPEMALKYYQLCQTAKTDPEIVKGIGDCYLMTGDFKAAFSAYEKILFNKNFLELGAAIAKILANNVQYERVEAYIKKTNGDDTLIVNKIADVFSYYGMEQLAIEWYEKCDIKSLSVGMQKEVGDYCFKKGDKDKAADCYLAYAISKKDYTFAKTIADELWKEKNHTSAIKLYELYAKNVRNTTTARLLADYYFDNRPSRAIEWYEEYYQLSRDDNEDVVRILIQLYERTYKPKDALKWYKILGDKLFAKGKAEEAVEVYSVYSKSCFDDRVSHRMLEYHFEKQDWDSALKYSKSIHNNTKQFDEKAVRGNIAICEKIVESCKYAKTRTNCHDVLNRWTKTLGDLLYVKGDNEGALAEYLKYNDPKYGYAVHDSIVKCYLNLGKAEKANEWYIENCGLCSDLDLIKRLGDACFDNKNAQYAIKHYERYCTVEEDKAAEAYRQDCIDIYRGSAVGVRKALISSNDYFYAAQSVAEAEYKKFLKTLETRGVDLSSGVQSFDEYSRLQGFKRYFDYENGAKYSDVVRRLASLYHDAGNAGKEREMQIKLGDVLRCNEDHVGAVEAYSQAGLNILEPDYARTLGNYYFKQGNLSAAEDCFEKSWGGKDFKLAREVADLFFGKGYKDKACNWYIRSWQGNKTADLARIIGDIYSDSKQPKEACNWYICSYIKEEDPELAIIIGDYYLNNGNQKEACTWYESSLEEKFNEDLERRVGAIYYNSGDKEKVLALHELCIAKHKKSFLDNSLIERTGDGFYKEGATDKAKRCYETIKNGESRIKLKLAECYYYSSDYENAKKALAAYSGKTVKVYTDFAFATGGTLFIAFDKHLIPVERSMVKKLELKNESGKKKTAVLYFSPSAPGVLPKKLKLFEGLDENDAIVKTLAETFKRKKKNVRIPRKLLKPSKSPKIRTRRSPRDVFGIALITVVGLIGLYIALAYAFSGYDGFTYWFWIVGIPFVVNTFITRFMCKKSPLAATIITWGTLALQYIINVVLQWWLWLDPNDGEPAVGEFMWYGIISPILSTCLFAFIYFLMMKVFSKDD